MVWRRLLRDRAVVAGAVVLILLFAAVPFAGTYHRFWLGLGAFGLDLVAVATLTGLLRNRLPGPVWRPIHLLSYLGWAIGVSHGVGIGTDTTTPWALAVTVASLALVAAAIVARWVIWRHERRLTDDLVLS